MTEKTYKNASDMIRDLTDDVELVEAVEEAVNRQKIVRHLMAMRAARGLSQKELADRIGCSQSRISKIESSADEELRFGDLCQYAHAVGCELKVGVRPGDLTPVDEVKSLASAVHDRLSRMSELAYRDEKIAASVTQFMCEAFMNFSTMVGRAASSLPKNPDGSPRLQVKVNVMPEEQPPIDSPVLS